MACRSFQLLKGFKLNVKYTLYIIDIFVKNTQCYVKMFMLALYSHELKFLCYTDKWAVLIPDVNLLFLHFKRKCI